jgi:protein-S-isoprenylcysteine O-methyltransferase Ste14
MLLEKAGRLLFRWRSFTPVPLLVVAALLIWRSRGPASPWWLVAGLLLCVLGQALRAWVLGQVQDGTSGQNEKLIAVALNTTGPYALTRNPLYLGNFGIVVGLCLVAHDPVLLVVATVLFALQYRAIIAAEEDFLRGRFGAGFDAYCARVPRFWPKIRGHHTDLRTAQMSKVSPEFDWRRALRKEHNPAAAWIGLAIVFVALDHERKWPYAIALAATAIAWLSVKGWKHRWLKGGFAEDLRRRLRESAR